MRSCQPLRQAVLAFGLCALASSAVAFHEGGAANCDGCHKMHPGALGDPTVGDLLLDDPSDLCLSCHALSAGAVLGADPLVPPAERGGGNFVFLLEDNLNDAVDGALDPIPGDAAGHNVVAPGAQLTADRRNSVAPGGSFPASQLGCTSCHDPHGQDTFRMLWGAGEVQGGVATFSYPAPDAIGISLSGPPESPSHHSAYRSGMSDWCANCHGRFHETGTGFGHPSAETLGQEFIDQYDIYTGDGNPTLGTHENAYLPEVPFEDASAAVGSRRGPTVTSTVTCLSCHRAHASSAPYAGRWDFNVQFLDDDGLASGSWPLPNPYFAGQGSLCTKCHQGGAPLPEIPLP